MSFAQTFYSENMGTPSSTTLITAYTGFQNTTPITYSGTGDVRTSTASSGYTGASGGGNVFLTSTAGKFLQIDGLNSSAYNASDIQLSFGYLTNSAATQLVVEFSTDATNWTGVTFTNNANTSWNLVTIPGGQIPSSTTLSLRFTQPATAQMRIDDIKLSNVSASCTLSLGTPTAVCDASTLGTDTYTVTIPYIGGGNATYTIVPNMGTVGGDSPTTVAAGNITVSGVAEGTNFSATVTGGTCNLSTSANSPECKPINTLPYSEPFTYTAGNSLGAEQKWTNVNSGDNIVAVAGSLAYTGLTSSGNSVSFSGAGIDCFTPYTNTTSGTLFSSFLINVTDIANVTTDLTETYFATLTDAAKGFKGRLFIKRNGTQYQLGLDSASTTTNYDATLRNVGDVVMVVLGYDFGSNTLSAWLNPDLSTFSETTTPTLTNTPATAFTGLGGFMLRQDGAASTPTITVDELRIAATTAELLSVKQNNAISGLKMYPNPVSNGTIFINTDANTEKTVVIYDMLGKQVINTTTTSNEVNVAKLHSGLYIVKITEEGKTATRKLVIE